MGCGQAKCINSLDRNSTSIRAHYKRQELLGEGHFAKIYKGEKRSDGSEVAMKIIKKNIEELKVEELREEIEIMKRLSHPNIVEFKDSFEDKDNIYVVMEHCKGGDLFDHILNSKCPMSEQKARKIIQQLLSAVEHCHSKGIAHRDIKPENILLTSTGDIKLTDFGLSTIYESNTYEMSTVLGTSSYVAPEIISGSYDLGVDIWSCGVILYLLLSRCLPYGGNTINQVIRNINFLRTPPFQGSVWSEVSQSAKDLVTRMLTINPLKRFHVAQALSHPWITDPDATLEVYQLIRDITQTLKDKNIYTPELSDLFHGIYQRNEGKDMENSISMVTQFIKKDNNLYAQNIKELFLESNTLNVDKIEIHVR